MAGKKPTPKTIEWSGNAQDAQRLIAHAVALMVEDGWEPLRIKKTTSMFETTVEREINALPERVTEYFGDRIKVQKSEGGAENDG